MLGMSLSEYQDYCKNLKVTDDTKELVEKIKKLQIASFFFLLSNIWHIAKNYNKC